MQQSTTAEEIKEITALIEEAQAASQELERITITWVPYINPNGGETVLKPNIEIIYIEL